MVFDWIKAAEIIKSEKPQRVSAGLRSDWEYTGGEIYRDGEIVTDDYTFLASTWATPEICVDGDVRDCYVVGHPTWDAGTKWPDEALAILNHKAPEHDKP
jgi:hypothetical protein